MQIKRTTPHPRYPFQYAVQLTDGRTYRVYCEKYEGKINAWEATSGGGTVPYRRYTLDRNRKMLDLFTEALTQEYAA